MTRNNSFFRILTDLLRRPDAASEDESKVAALTHDRRDAWHRNRRRFFLADEVNRETLETIESAMIFLVLDERDDYIYKPVSNCGREIVTPVKSKNFACTSTFVSLVLPRDYQKEAVKNEKHITIRTSTMVLFRLS